MADPDRWTAQAEELAGQHYYCDDPLYCCSQCPECCTDERRRGKPCDCGLAERVVVIIAVLREAHEQGWREALEEAALLVRGLSPHGPQSLRWVADDVANGYNCAQIDAIAAIRAKLGAALAEARQDVAGGEHDR